MNQLRFLTFFASASILLQDLDSVSHLACLAEGPAYSNIIVIPSMVGLGSTLPLCAVLFTIFVSL